MCVQEQTALASCLFRFYSSTAELVRREAKNISPRSSFEDVVVFVLPAILKKITALSVEYVAATTLTLLVLLDCALVCLYTQYYSISLHSRMVLWRDFLFIHETTWQHRIVLESICKKPLYMTFIVSIVHIMYSSFSSYLFSHTSLFIF